MLLCCWGVSPAIQFEQRSLLHAETDARGQLSKSGRIALQKHSETDWLTLDWLDCVLCFSSGLHRASLSDSLGYYSKFFTEHDLIWSNEENAPKNKVPESIWIDHFQLAHHGHLEVHGRQYGIGSALDGFRVVRSQPVEDVEVVNTTKAVQKHTKAWTISGCWFWTHGWIWDSFKSHGHARSVICWEPADQQRWI